MTLLIRRLIVVLVLSSAIASEASDSPPPVAPPPVAPLEIADASISISGGIVALGIGYEWAKGTLVYRGRTYPFRVRGFSFMDIGAAKITGSGEVFNLKYIADFEGKYAGSTFGSAVYHGLSLALFENEHGVSIRARSTISGVRLNFSGSGIHIRFTDQSRSLGASPPKTAEAASGHSEE